jgi:hypothetical protein
VKSAVNVVGVFMQNKPNFLNTKMNISSFMTNYYERKMPLRTPKKQTQSNPTPRMQSKQKSQPENSQLASEEGDKHKLYILGEVIQVNV